MHILLRSSWQSVNIGDIAHTLAFLELQKREMPDIQVTHWASGEVSDEAIALEYKYYPGIIMVKGTIQADGTASNPALQKAIDDCDMLLHNSGPMLVALDDIEMFVKATSKPYGIFGITYDGNPYYTNTLNKAKFIYFRDSVSLKMAIAQGLKSPQMQFGPDVAFLTKVFDHEKAAAFLEKNKLHEGKFVCCIPRLRYTPFWLTKDWVPFDSDKQNHNEKHKENDHRYLLMAIEKVVKETGMKVLICPEDMHEIQIGKELLYDHISAELREKVVWRENFWMPDEALAVYIRSVGLFGNEMHSPIMCVGNRIPAIVCRSKEQTTKGIMWQDIGLGDWLFDLDDEDRMKQLPETVVDMVCNKEQSLKKVRDAIRFVKRANAPMLQSIRQVGQEMILFEASIKNMV